MELETALTDWVDSITVAVPGVLAVAGLMVAIVFICAWASAHDPRRK